MARWESETMYEEPYNNIGGVRGVPGPGDLKKGGSEAKAVASSNSAKKGST